jgi:hypothetical protein
VETEVLDDNTQFETEEETPEDISLDELLESDDKGNAEQGLDSPPSPEQTEDTPQAEEPKPVDRSFLQGEVDAIVVKRLKEARAKWEKEHADAQKADAELDKQAQEFLVKNPETKLPVEFVKTLLKAQQPVQPEQEQPVTTPVNEEQQKFEAWKQSLIDEEPLLKILLNDPQMTNAKYMAQNPAYEAALRAGNTPKQAFSIAQRLEPLIQKTAATAKADAQKEVLQKVQNSNDRATTPVSSVKNTGKATSSIDWIKTAPIEDLRSLLERGPVRVG